METMNHEHYVSFEIAKLLKEAGFDWECIEYYPSSFMACRYEDYVKPTLDVAQRWLREVHHLHITIFSSSQESWMFRITKQHQSLEDGVYGEDFYSYEEAQEAGIKKALEIILAKGE